MAVEPQLAPQRLADTDVSTCRLNDAWLNADITVNKPSQCIKCLKHGKNPGIDGILADMVEVQRWRWSCAAVPAVDIQLLACQPTL